jgi:hypothetical protein
LPANRRMPEALLGILAPFARNALTAYSAPSRVWLTFGAEQ